MVHLPVNVWSYQGTDPEILSCEICKSQKLVTETKSFQAESACRTEGNEHCLLLACVELLHCFLI